MAVATVTTASGATWQQVAADRQRHRNATIASITPAIPKVEEIPLNTTTIAAQILTPEELLITESLVEELVPSLATGDLTCFVVTNAFLRRAALAQQATNCVTELLPERALTRAAFLDDYLNTNHKPIGPLHGLPISVKEHIGMKGLDLNAGFISWVGRIGEEDAHILQILWKAGAVFYARTTQPQTLMHLETSSNIYGVTVNPFNTTLTCGGSSGGEGALIGFRGSCLGIGTDIGGSIRSPAANNGLYGIKPTSGRLPVSGWSATMLGQEQVHATIGPLSTSLQGCKLMMKTLIDAQPWNKEPSLLPFSWNNTNFFPPTRKLKVAVMWDDGVVRVHPPVTRVLREVVEKLKEKENVVVVDWQPWKHDEAWEILASLYFADGGAEEKAAIATSSEPILPLSSHILIENPHVKPHSVETLWNATIKREAYRTSYASLWNSTSTSTGPNGELEGMIDVILCPVGPGAAPRLGTSKYWGYTSQWNLLDYPAVVFPVGVVDIGKDGGDEEKGYEGRNEMDIENWGYWENNGANGYKDAPICLQLVGRRFEDEKMIQALEIIMEETGVPFVKSF